MSALERTIAVAGGGIAGLSVAEAILRRSREAGAPIRAVVLEADAVPGGKIRSSNENGFVIESGPHGFLDREPVAMALIDRLGLRGSMLRANEEAANRFIVRDGKLRKVPSSPPAFLASDVLPMSAKLRVLREPFVPARRSGGEESVFEFASRRIGVGAAEQLVDAMVTGIFGGDSRRLSLDAAFPRMRELEDQYGSLIKAQAKVGGPKTVLHSFRAGLGELIAGLASAVGAGGEIRCGARAERISPEGARFVIEGPGLRVEADAVVLALPADVCASLIAPLGGAAALAAVALGEIPYVPIAVVVHGFDAGSVGRALDGFGFLSPAIEQRSVLGTIWASTVFPPHVPEGAVMTRTMIGGWRSPELAALPDAELFQLVRKEFASLMGLPANVPAILEKVIRWPRAIPQYNLGHLEKVAAADRAEAEVPGLFFAGNAFRGVAMISQVADADKVAARAVAQVLGARA